MENTNLPQDMKDALTQFDSTADRIVKKFLESLESREPPEIIYHYSNDVGLRGILESGKLWLSEIGRAHV